MDLLELAVEGDTPKPCRLTHFKTGEPLTHSNGTEVVINLFGMDSEAYQRSDRRSRQASRDAAFKRKGGLKPAEEDDLVIEMLVECTAGWQGIPAGWVDGSPNAEPIEFNRANCRRLYENRKFKWVREQVNDFISDRANFAPASSTS